MAQHSDEQNGPFQHDASAPNSPAPVNMNEQAQNGQVVLFHTAQEFEAYQLFAPNQFYSSRNMPPERTERKRIIVEVMEKQECIEICYDAIKYFMTIVVAFSVIKLLTQL